MLSEYQTKPAIWFGRGKDYYKAKNYAQAFNCYLKAAEGGNIIAQHEVGFCLFGGIGVDRDELIGFHWMHQAAKNGSGEALNFLGVFYAEGWSDWLEIDFAEAYKFFILARRQGDKNATCWLATVRTWASLRQKAEGRKRAQEFISLFLNNQLKL